MSGRYWRSGFSRPDKRWDDPLSRMDPLKFEALVAAYYRRQGYRVEECGGGKGRFDGGIDLKLYRDGEYVVVQCKRYTKSVVTHNPVHELLGVMQTEGATRAIFINSGEYSHHALKKLRGIPNFEMIDGAQLREMIAPLIEGLEEPRPQIDDPYREFIRGSTVEKQRSLSEEAAERLARRPHTYSAASRKKSEGLGPLLKIILMLVFLLLFHRWSKSLDSHSPPKVPAATQQHQPLQSKADIPGSGGEMPAKPMPVRTNALQAGERCINNQRFRRLENGWEQIGSC